MLFLDFLFDLIIVNSHHYATPKFSISLLFYFFNFLFFRFYYFFNFLFFLYYYFFILLLSITLSVNHYLHLSLYQSILYRRRPRSRIGLVINYFTWTWLFFSSCSWVGWKFNCLMRFALCATMNWGCWSGGNKAIFCLNSATIFFCSSVKCGIDALLASFTIPGCCCC